MRSGATSTVPFDVHLFDEGLDEASATEEVYKHMGILRYILEEAVEQGEWKGIIRCADGVNHFPVRKGNGKAPSRTSKCLKRFVDGKNEMGESVTAAACKHYFHSTPRSDDEYDAFRIPAHVSRQAA